MFCHAPTTRKPNAHMFCHAPMYTSFVPYHHVMEAKCANERARFWRFASLLLLGLAFPKAAGLLIRFAVDFIFTMALIHLVCAFFGGVSSFACRKFCSGKRCCSNKPPRTRQHVVQGHQVMLLKQGRQVGEHGRTDAAGQTSE